MDKKILDSKIGVFKYIYLAFKLAIVLYLLVNFSNIELIYQGF